MTNTSIFNKNHAKLFKNIKKSTEFHNPVPTNTHYVHVFKITTCSGQEGRGALWDGIGL